MAKDVQRLREYIRARMGEVGLRRLPDLAEAAGVSVATVNNVLAGSGTLSRQAVESALGWGPGSIRAVLDGQAPVFVGPGSEDEEAPDDELRFQRPPGLSEDEWAVLRRQQERIWQAMIDEYSARR